MAKKVEKKGKSLEDMEKEITCAICQEHYTEPKVLPCLHYYCKMCVLKLKTASNEPFPCPECRKETTLPEGGVDELKTAFFINRFKSNYYALERVHGKVEVKCEACAASTNTAEAFCRQCAAFICRKCVRAHKRMNMFASHKVASLEDLKLGKALVVTVKESPTKKCDLHEEPLTVFCFDCSSLICRDCTVKIHRDHSFEFSKVAAPSTKKNLLDDLTSLKDITVNLSEGLKDIQTTKQEIEDQGSSVIDIINNSFNELRQILKIYKQQLLQEATSKFREKIEKLSVREKNLSLAKAKVQSIVESTERFLDHCSDNEVMNMHAEIKENIKRSITEHGQSETTTIPLEEADVGVEVVSPAYLHQLCQTETRITRLLLDLAQCTVTGERLETAELHQTIDLTLTSKFRGQDNIFSPIVANFRPWLGTPMHGGTFSLVPNQCRAMGGRPCQQMPNPGGQQRIGRRGGIDRMQQQSKQMKFNQSVYNQPATPAANTPPPVGIAAGAPMHGRTFGFVPNQCRAMGGGPRQQMPRPGGQQRHIGRCGGIDRMQQQSKQMKFSQSACNQPAAPAANIPLPVAIAAGASATATATGGDSSAFVQLLTELDSQQQKQLIGEQLYKQIYTLHKELAGKITGMLLEMDNSDLLHMLEVPESLKSKVGEAVSVLHDHQLKNPATTSIAAKS